MEELAISRILDQRTEISPRRGRSRGQRSRAKAPSPTPETYWEITVASAAPPPASSSSADDTAPPPASSEPLPEETPEPEQTPDAPAAPVEQTPMEGVYPVASQDDAAALLEQAYTQFAPELTVSFSDQTLTWEERWMLLQNASSQVFKERPELKYACQLDCADGDEGTTVCTISYMPYKLGYPQGIPEGAAEIRSLAELIAAANAALGAEEIPVAILDPALLVDDMQRALQMAGYGYLVYTLNSDATAIRAFPADPEMTLEESAAFVQDLQDRVRTLASELFTGDMTEEETLRAIYRYITENTVYDNRYYQAPETLPYASRTAQGPLMEGTAICGGFSWAFRMLCEEAGIPCWNVTGTGAGEEHMWNCARLDGEYRYFDTTWDCGSTDESQWRYFARTEEEFTKSHQWGPGQAALIHQLTEE